jgi:hypothetical protein
MACIQAATQAKRENLSGKPNEEKLIAATS